MPGGGRQLPSCSPTQKAGLLWSTLQARPGRKGVEQEGNGDLGRTQGKQMVEGRRKRRAALGIHLEF